MGSCRKILNSGHAYTNTNTNTNADTNADTNTNTNADTNADTNANAWNRCCLAGRFNTCGSDVGWRRWGWLELGWD